MRLIFAGTPAFAATILDVLLGGSWEVVGVLTQPDRPAGRGRKLTGSPVKQLADRHGIPVDQPRSLEDPAARLAGWRADVMVVAAYGLLLPASALALPILGCINVHASLLPRWRGAAPIQHAILAGDRETGVSIMRMDAGLDTGPVLHRLTCPVRDDDTAGALEARLAELGARALVEILPAVQAGTARATAQEQALATYAPRIHKSQGWIDWRLPARVLERQIRAFDPWPVSCTRLPASRGERSRDPERRRLRIRRARVITAPPGERPGTVLASARDGIDVMTAEGGLRILEVQTAGSRRVPVADYLNAHVIPVGMRFEGPGDGG